MSASYWECPRCEAQMDLGVKDCPVCAPPAAAAAPGLTEEQCEEIRQRWETFAAGRIFVGGIADALQDIRRLLAVAAHHRAEGERWKARAEAWQATAELQADLTRTTRERAERAEAALREIERMTATTAPRSMALRAVRGVVLRALAGARPGETT